jgi:hypothetical protein
VDVHANIAPYPKRNEEQKEMIKIEFNDNGGFNDNNRKVTATHSRMTK